ncbi:MAG TPA: undecaprenyl diphosphate synthase family protein, partial [Steroidobacteraceae bacterium]|nr:undecaprenyl diphosphate synthase family protein [Steroidobacteraceae bacterium]
MDGNGRWAEARGLARHAGHKEGVRPVRLCIEECARRGVGALTLFAFSSENWQRPTVEVTSLMQLFLDAIDREV